MSTPPVGTCTPRITTHGLFESTASWEETGNNAKGKNSINACAVYHTFCFARKFLDRLILVLLWGCLRFIVLIWDLPSFNWVSKTKGQVPATSVRIDPRQTARGMAFSAQCGLFIRKICFFLFPFLCVRNVAEFRWHHQRGKVHSQLEKQNAQNY